MTYWQIMKQHKQNKKHDKIQIKYIAFFKNINETLDD